MVELRDIPSVVREARIPLRVRRPIYLERRREAEARRIAELEAQRRARAEAERLRRERKIIFKGEEVELPYIRKAGITTKKQARQLQTRIVNSLREGLGREPTKEEISEFRNIVYKGIQEAGVPTMIYAPAFREFRYPKPKEVPKEVKLPTEPLALTIAGYKIPFMEKGKRYTPEETKKLLKEYISGERPMGIIPVESLRVTPKQLEALREGGFEEVSYKKYEQSKEIPLAYDVQAVIVDGRPKYLRKFVPEQKVREHLIGEISQRDYGKPFNELTPQQQRDVKSIAQQSIEVFAEEEKMKREFKPTPVKLDLRPISVTGVPLAERPKPKYFPVTPSQIGRQLTVEDWLGIGTIFETVVPVAKYGVEEGVRVAYAEQMLGRTRWVSKVAVTEPVKVGEVKLFVPQMAEASAIVGLEAGMGALAFGAKPTTAVTKAFPKLAPVVKGVKAVKIATPYTVRKAIRPVTMGLVGLYGAKEIVEAYPKVGIEFGAPKRVGFGALMLGAGILETTRVAERYYARRSLLKEVKKLPPSQRAEFERYMASVKKISGTEPTVKNINLKGMERIPKKAQTPIKSYLKETGDVVGGSVAQRTQIYGKSRIPADIDLYTKGDPLKRAKGLEKLLKQSGVPRVSRVGSKITIAGKKAVEYHDIDKFLANVRQVSYFGSGVTETPEGIKVMKLGIQAQRKLVGGYVGKRPKDVADFKDIMKSYFKSAEIEAKGSLFESTRLANLQESKSLFTGKVKPSPSFLTELSTRLAKGRKGIARVGIGEAPEELITPIKIEPTKPVIPKAIKPRALAKEYYYPTPYKKPVFISPLYVTPAYAKPKYPTPAYPTPITYPKAITPPTTYPKAIAPPSVYPKVPTKPVTYPKPITYPKAITPPTTYPKAIVTPTIISPITQVYREIPKKETVAMRKRRKLLAQYKSYLLYVKQRGKFKKVGKAMTKSDALDYGAEIVDKTPSAQFKIVSSKARPKTEPRVSKGYFRFNIDKFRPFKIRRKITIPMKEQYIEKTKHRIDSMGEFEGITVKGWITKTRKAEERKMGLGVPTFKLW